MGTQGQFTTQSGTTVEGGPGLVLDNVLDVPRNNVHQGVDHRRVLKVQCLHVVLPELVLEGGDGRSGLLDSVPEGDIGGQLVHIGLHSEHIGSVVLERSSGEW